VITGACDDTLIWWPTAVENPEPIRKVVAHKGWIRAVAVSPDGKLLASGGNDRVVKLWNMDDGNLVAELAGHERDVYSVRFHPNGQFLLSGDLMGKVHQWELATSKILRTFDASALHTYNGGQQVDYGGVRDIELSPDQTRLICAGLHKATNPLGAVSDPLVLQFDWEATTLLKSHTADLRGIAWRAIWHAQNFLFAASGGSGGGFLLFWKPDEEAPFHKLQLPNIVREMDLHPDGRQIATAHHDQHLRITKI
jgi:WD40 repeat protein